MVQQLTPKGLQKAIRGNAIIDFYAPWCPHCQKLEPVFEQLSNQVPRGVSVLKMNMDKHQTAVEAQNIGEAEFGQPIHSAIQGFPTILMFRSDGETMEYNGPRTLKPMVDATKAFFDTTSMLRGGGAESSKQSWFSYMTGVGKVDQFNIYKILQMNERNQNLILNLLNTHRTESRRQHEQTHNALARLQRLHQNAGGYDAADDDDPDDPMSYDDCSVRRPSNFLLGGC